MFDGFLAQITNILTTPSGEVCGVRARQNGKGGGASVDIRAPIVVSSAGVFNTFERLLDPDVCSGHPSIARQLEGVRHGCSCFSLFVGLRGDKKELQLPAASYWALPSTNLDKVRVQHHCDVGLSLVHIRVPNFLTGKGLLIVKRGRFVVTLFSAIGLCSERQSAWRFKE